MKQLFSHVVIAVAVLFCSAIFVDTARAEVSADMLTMPPRFYDGRLVKVESNSAVYYIGLDEKRHAFPNANIYFSWYQNFSKVEVISDFEMAFYPLGSNVLYRPGSRLVKIAEVPEVYAVEPGGMLRNIPSEQVAIELYGSQWHKKVDDLDISFFFDYDIAGVIEVIDQLPVYPRGTVVFFDGGNYLIDRRTDGLFLMRPVTPQAWDVNGFDRVEQQVLTNYALREFFEIGLPVALQEAAFACPSCEDFMTQRQDISSTKQHVSDDGGYRVVTPANWGVSFSSQDEFDQSRILLALSPEQEIVRSLFAWQDPGDAETLKQMVDARLEVLKHAKLYYAGESPWLGGGYDMIYSFNDITADPFATDLQWERYIQRGSNVYRLDVTTQLGAIDMDHDVADLLLRSFTVDPLIAG